MLSDKVLSVSLSLVDQKTKGLIGGISQIPIFVILKERKSEQTVWKSKKMRIAGVKILKMSF